MASSVPDVRLSRLNDAPLRVDGDHVLYWMVAQRRTTHNFALDRACAHAIELGKPLVILEALRCGYRWASDRIHAFVLQGMADNRDACREHDVAWYGYVEPQCGAGSGLLQALSERACVVVTDEWPCFFVPRMQRAAARRLSVAVEAVDSCGLLPLRTAPRAFSRAFDFRRFLQKRLAPHLRELPSAAPLERLRGLPRASLPRGITARWPLASADALRAAPGFLASLPIDHAVEPSAVLHGGARAGTERLRTFLRDGLGRYADARNHPDDDAQSGLSPWLHFGHVGAHQVFAELVRRERWTPARLGLDATGASDGWWGMERNAEAFLDELVTWRELGLNLGFHRPDDFDRFDALPGWARATLAEHAGDPRPRLYTLAELAASKTDDEIWNAAQTQLRTEGRIHNYLRMLWGKKVLGWTPDARTAADVLIELNNRFAIDGRDPNSYSGIFWVLGRYDRAWGPERPIFGKVRYMTSDSTRRKLRLSQYLARYAPRAASQRSLPGLDVD
ncbi:MAG: deoxyribodipyrimidine photolyase [Planctomycetes bacterium]|nr:deoxyribodipyrimidine photolyase [Planctomycetota bacterium]